MAHEAQPIPRWTSRPVQAWLVRAVVLVAPLAGSLAFVHYATQLVGPPTSSFWLFLAWWFGLVVSATLVLFGVDRVARRLLPLAALLRLSLIFPDEAPSRFKTALRSGSVDTLERRLELMQEARESTTAREAAGRLLELVAALDAHDHLTRGHSERVRAYSVMIGRQLGLSAEEVDLLNWAALLHDVGKLEVPPEILNKNGKPSAEEWAVLRRHPLFGEELAAPMHEWLGSWWEAIGYHHEHWDGHGYPRGVSDDQIPLAGRIVAVADVFDVITSVRSYKEAGAATTGRVEIERCSGSQFDPRVVRAFLNVSLGRMRLVMGPLSLLSHLQLLSRVPLTPAMGTLAGAFAVVTGSLAGGFVAQPADARIVSTEPALVASGPRAPVSVSGSSTQVRTRPPHQSAHAARTPHKKTKAGGPSGVTATVNARPVPSQQTAPSGIRVANQPKSPASGNESAPAAGTVQAASPVESAEPVSPAEEPAGQEQTTPTASTTATQTAPAPARQVPASQTAPASTGPVTTTPRPAAAALPAAADAHEPVRPGDTTVVDVINQPPTFTAGPNQTVLEDAGAQSVSGWATSISAGPSNESGQTVSFSVTADNPGLFSSQPAVAANGTLSFTPAIDATGVATISVRAVDDGGTANGGQNTSSAQTATITVLAVNQPPSFTAGSSQTVLEDAGAQSVNGWATSISPGAAGESSQVVSFTVSNTDPSLFSAQPAVASNGRLTYTPAANANGSAAVTVRAVDDGGTANGGNNTSAPQTFTIALTAVNDAPSFVAGSNQSAVSLLGAQVVTGWATGISAGPANESAQTVTFTVTATNSGLFAVQPAVSSNGTLTYTPNALALGTATVTVRAVDSGGTAAGGADTSGAQTFTITIL